MLETTSIYLLLNGIIIEKMGHDDQSSILLTLFLFLRTILKEHRPQNWSKI